MKDLVYKEDVLQALVDCYLVQGAAYRQMEDAINALPVAPVPSDYQPDSVSSCGLPENYDEEY